MERRGEAIGRAWEGDGQLPDNLRTAGSWARRIDPCSGQWHSEERKSNRASEWPIHSEQGMEEEAMSTWDDRIYTKRFAESVGGILLCGINPGDGGGGRVQTFNEGAPKSYFSDVTCQNASFRFQRRIRDWFRLWGHPLSEARPGKFERSISQANWIGESTRYADEHYSREALVKCAKAQFFPILEAVRPRLLVFFGVQHLPGAFSDPRLRDREVELFGAVTSEMQPIWKDRSIGKGRFRAMSMGFERCQVLGLPHPTPKSRPLSDEDAAQLKDVFSRALVQSGL